MKKNRWIISIIIGFILITGAGCQFPLMEHTLERPNVSKSLAELSPDTIPDYSGEDTIILNGNIPGFTEEDFENIKGEYYSDLDFLGRCGTCFSCLHQSLMPTEERGPIGMMKPSGWQTVKYPGIIEDKYLYNRCHLIAYAMTGQNDNEKNLITGTRYFNVSLMLPYEKQVLRYLDDTENHVLYRVTPLFRKNELVARGVQMEAYSLEDQGTGICLNVFIYNIQPGIVIDYKTGDSRAE